MANKVNTLSADAKAILEILKNATGPMTLAQINEVNGTEFKTGTIVSLIKKGLISKGEDAEVEYVARKMVGTYRIG
jgi:adenine C2-methylase RlmN of 23S rRNA A2503 and tRNA A37